MGARWSGAGVRRRRLSSPAGGRRRWLPSASVGRRVRERRRRLLLALIVIVVGLGVVACERRPPWPQRGAPSPDDLAARLRALQDPVRVSGAGVRAGQGVAAGLLAGHRRSGAGDEHGRVQPVLAGVGAGPEGRAVRRPVRSPTTGTASGSRPGWRRTSPRTPSGASPSPPSSTARRRGRGAPGRASPVAPGFEVFCVPDDPADYARFAGMIARYFDGRSGHGRITDFVIQNEVNMNQWFNVGCGAGVPCDLDAWVADYARLYNGAYDAIRSAQRQARVLFSFTAPLRDHVRPARPPAPRVLDQDLPAEAGAARRAPASGRSRCTRTRRTSPRRSTPGTCRSPPSATSAWSPVGCAPPIPTTRTPGRCSSPRSGLANDGRFDDAQRAALCQAFRNVLGTPGITSFIYHRLLDNPDEGILKLGLRRDDGTPKPAFDLWRHVNDPGAEQCGFELDGHTVVRHGIDPTTGAHWYSSRVLAAWLRRPARRLAASYARRPATAMLYECGAPGGRSTYLSRDAACGGDVPMGPVGWISRIPRRGWTPLVACHGPDAVVVRSALRCDARGAARPARVRRARRHDQRRPADRSRTAPAQQGRRRHEHERRKAMTAGVTVVSPDAPTAALTSSCVIGVTSRNEAFVPPASRASTKSFACAIRRAGSSGDDEEPRRVVPTAVCSDRRALAPGRRVVAEGVAVEPLLGAALGHLAGDVVLGVQGRPCSARGRAARRHR